MSYAKKYLNYFLCTLYIEFIVNFLKNSMRKLQCTKKIKKE